MQCNAPTRIMGDYFTYVKLIVFDIHVANKSEITCMQIIQTVQNIIVGSCNIVSSS